MTLAVGRRLGPYEVVGALGAGGMGEVYKARDTKLQRDVALKILPELFAADPDRLARFEREALVLASLNHPNIAAIYGLEESNGVRALVLELVEGPTLADRIAHGPIPIDEALPIARQIAEALEGAHEPGIIHRDLKPSNIKVRGDGTVKVLDFGLARALDPATPSGDISQSPTLTSPAATRVGVIMGTAAYMSPEQARGKAVDKRADIWGFGCVLYEMLTGTQAFAGDDVTDTLAAIVRGEPDWGRLPTETPPAIRRLLRRCLTKELKGRVPDAAIARIEIDEAHILPQMDVAVPHSASARKERLAWISALGFVTLIAAAAIIWAFRPVPSVPEARLEITTPPSTDPASLALSPDGQKIVFVGTSQDQSGLWLRSLDSVSSRPLAGTDRGRRPFWSPDGRSVGFFTDGKLKRIDIDTGSVQTLANVAADMGGAWNREGTILFAPSTFSPLLRISAAGGDSVAVTGLDPRQATHRFPHFLPDGRHFLYYARGSPETSGIYVSQLEETAPRRLVDSDSAGVYASGHLLFIRQGTLFAQRFDPVRLELSGNQIPVAEQVGVSGSADAALSASSSGSLIYRTGSAGGQRQFVWFDRSGKETERVGRPFDGSSPSMSPDGRRVALYRGVGGNLDVWLLELARGVLSRFTSDVGTDTFPFGRPTAAA